MEAGAVQRPREVPRSTEAGEEVARRQVPQVLQFLEEMVAGLELQEPHQVAVVGRPVQVPAEASASLLSRSNTR